MEHRAQPARAAQRGHRAAAGRLPLHLRASQDRIREEPGRPPPGLRQLHAAVPGRLRRVVHHVAGFRDGRAPRADGDRDRRVPQGRQGRALRRLGLRARELRQLLRLSEEVADADGPPVGGRRPQVAVLGREKRGSLSDHGPLPGHQPRVGGLTVSVLGVADAAFWIKTLVVGAVSGVLSGMFGIGGGMITTPAIRLLLGGSAIAAVATPLPIIIPTAITGAVGYTRRGLADVRAGWIVGGSGALAAVAGAYATRWIGGSALMIATGVLVVYMAADMLFAGRRAGAGAHAPEPSVSASEEGPLLVSDDAVDGAPASDADA